MMGTLSVEAGDGGRETEKTGTVLLIPPRITGLWQYLSG